MTYLHFIGKEYYSISKFIKEAKLFGVSRRVNLLMLKKFEFGDKIYLFQWDKTSSILFGYFIFEKILGLDTEII